MNAASPGWEHEDDLPSEVTGEPSSAAESAKTETAPVAQQETETQASEQQSENAPAATTEAAKTETAPVVEKAEAAEPEELPADINACYKLLRELEALPEKTAKQEQEKAAKINPLRKHIVAIQQGLPTIHIDAHAYGHSVARQDLKRTRLEYLARTDLAVKELLADRDSLAEENSALKIENAALEEKISNLTK